MLRMIVTMLGSMLLATVPLHATAQRPQVPEVAEALQQRYAAYDRPYTPGFIVALVHGNQLVHIQGIGRANREMDVAWTGATRYRLASWSKTLLAQAAFGLEAEGKLRLDDPVSRFVPDAPDFMSGITLRHLITMTSGLRQDELLVNLAGQKGFVTLEEMWGLTRQQGRLDFEPGSFQRYVDTNSRLLTLALQAASGLSYGELMRTYVFAPAAMSSSLTAAYYREMTDGQATTYIKRAEGFPWRREVAHPSSGDGGVVSTMDDAVLWLLHITRRGASGSIFDKLSNPVRLPSGEPAPYAHGSYEVSFDGVSARGHGHGGATGTFWAYFPQHDVGVLVFTNYQGALVDTEVAADAVRAYLRRARPDALRGLPENAAPPLVEEGFYVNPASGEFLRLMRVDGEFHVDLMGAAYRLSGATEGPWTLLDDRGERFPARLGLGRCHTGEGGVVLHGYWGQDTSCYSPAKSVPDQAPPVGYFHSEELASGARIMAESKGANLLLGPGIGFNHYGETNLRIEPAGPDLWRTEELGLRVLRDEKGAVQGFFLSANGARMIWFGALPLPQPRPSDSLRPGAPAARK